MEGLNDGLQYQLVSHTFASFQQLVDKALVVENKRYQMEDKKRKFQGQQSRSNTHVCTIPHQAYPQQGYQGQSSLINYNQQPQRAQQQQQYKAPVQHQQQANNVPVKGNVSNVPPKNGAPKAPNAINDNKCFSCGELGHYSNRCPKKLANVQQNYVRGKINHVTIEIAQEAPDVVIGTFPIISNLAIVSILVLRILSQHILS